MKFDENFRHVNLNLLCKKRLSRDELSRVKESSLNKLELEWKSKEKKHLR